MWWLKPDLIKEIWFRLMSISATKTSSQSVSSWEVESIQTTFDHPSVMESAGQLFMNPISCALTTVPSRGGGWGVVRRALTVLTDRKCTDLKFGRILKGFETKYPFFELIAFLAKSDN